MSRCEALARELCAIPSVTGDERACADAIERRLRATRYEVTRVDESVLARSPRTGRPLVLLVGHTDTVPGKPGDGPVRVVGDRLFGLGASDMKGGLAVMVALAEDLDPAALAYDVGFVFYDREEGPWADSGLGPVLDHVPWLKEAALAFCLEPSDNVVQVGCMGSMHARVRFVGRSAHSARPWQGENAIHAAAPLLARLAARAPVDVERDGHVFREVVSATQAQGGTARNVIPDRFELNLNYRFAPGRSLEEAEAELRALVGEGPEVDFVERAPAGRVVGRNALLQRFLALNGNAVAAKQAWTDVARLGQAGVDAVNLGPGLAAQAHQAGEWASLALLEESYAQFRRFLTAG
ncbi:MAG: succinyl-diaminopimelate desuccinylase [Myxococcota bacterium]